MSVVVVGKQTSATADAQWHVLCGVQGCNAAPGSKYLQLWLNLNRI